jgi:hypothetical protein
MEFAMIAVETLYLTALMSAFVGFIALFALSAPGMGRSFRVALANFVVLAAVASVLSFLTYALSGHDAARSVYGAANIGLLRL